MNLLVDLLIYVLFLIGVEPMRRSNYSLIDLLRVKQAEAAWRPLTEFILIRWFVKGERLLSLKIEAIIIKFEKTPYVLVQIVWNEKSDETKVSQPRRINGPLFKGPWRVMKKEKSTDWWAWKLIGVKLCHWCLSKTRKWIGGWNVWSTRSVMKLRYVKWIDNFAMEHGLL